MLRTARQRQVVHFEVRVVLQDLLSGHPTGEPFQHGKHRVSQATNDGLAMTNVWVARDATQEFMLAHGNRYTLHPRSRPQRGKLREGVAGGVFGAQHARAQQSAV